jgi:hypothetical protein
LCLSVRKFQLERSYMDSNEIRYGHYVIRRYPRLVFLNILRSVIPTWQTQKRVMWEYTSAAVCIGVKPPSGTQDQILVTIRQLQICFCRAPSQTRGLVCWFSSWARISRDWWPYFTVSDYRISPGGPGSVFITPRTVWSTYNRRYQIPSSSLPTTRRATVLEPASTRTSRIEFLINCINTFSFVPHRKHVTSRPQRVTG